MRMQETLTDIINKTPLTEMLDAEPRPHNSVIIQKFAMEFVNEHHELIKKALSFDDEDYTGEEDAYIIDVTEGMIASIIEEDWAFNEETQRIADELIAGIKDCCRKQIRKLHVFDCLKLIKQFSVWEWNENVYSITDLAIMGVEDVLLDNNRSYFTNEIASYFVFKYWNEED